jgi:hypothetical protein
MVMITSQRITSCLFASPILVGLCKLTATDVCTDLLHKCFLLPQADSLSLCPPPLVFTHNCLHFAPFFSFLTAQISEEKRRGIYAVSEIKYGQWIFMKKLMAKMPPPGNVLPQAYVCFAGACIHPHARTEPHCTTASVVQIVWPRIGLMIPIYISWLELIMRVFLLCDCATVD